MQWQTWSWSLPSVKSASVVEHRLIIGLYSSKFLLDRPHSKEKPTTHAERLWVSSTDFPANQVKLFCSVGNSARVCARKMHQNFRTRTLLQPPTSDYFCILLMHGVISPSWSTRLCQVRRHLYSTTRGPNCSSCKRLNCIDSSSLPSSHLHLYVNLTDASTE